MKKFRLSLIYASTAALLGSGCASFEKEWQAARQHPVPTADITGAWSGTWQNTNNAHSGALRAIVTPSGADSYTARFHATWAGHSGSFHTQLKGSRQGDDFVFEGRKRILGFLIVTRGRASATDLFSTYESRFDTGTFTLHRPTATE